MFRRTVIPSWLPFAIVVLAVASRFLPHPWNVTPVGAMFLFCGFTSVRLASLAVPLTAYGASDLALDLLVYHAPFGIASVFVWFGFALVWLIGRAVRRCSSPWSLYAASLAGSLVFFAVSNLGVWLGGHLYPHTLAGLAVDYIAGIPFFQATLVGDLIFNTLFFGVALLLGLSSVRRVTSAFRGS